MEINVANLYIDTVHRLPSSGRGPRPIIIKFIFKLDRKWCEPEKPHSAKSVRTYSYENTLTKKSVRNIRKLLLIRRAAIAKANMSAWSRID